MFVDDIVITDTVCLSQWHFLNILGRFMQYTGKTSLLTTDIKAAVTL